MPTARFLTVTGRKAPRLSGPSSLIGAAFDPGYLTAYQHINRALWLAVEKGELTPGVVKVRRFELLL